MVTLSNILLEIESNQATDELGKEINDLFHDELTQQNEAILTVAALTLSLPGIINGIAKIGKAIATKYYKGFDLTKHDSNAWYNVLEKFTEKIDDYIGKPLDIMLKPIISDDIKRKKVTNLLKAISITTLAVVGSVDITKSTTVLAYFKSIAGSFANELIQLVSEKNLPNIITFAKQNITALLK